MEFQLHNVYNPSPSLVTSENPLSLVSARELIQREGEYILLGDFNLHHPNWNNHGRYTHHHEADQLVAMTVEQDMELTLPEEAVTWRARGHESTINLIFATPAVKETIRIYRIRPKLQYGSDYLPVYTELDLSIEEPEATPRRAWKTAVPKDIERGAQVLASALPLIPLLTIIEVDCYLAKLQQGLAEVVEETVPWAKPAKRAKSFWNADCKEATKEAAQKTRHYQNDRSHTTERERSMAIKKRNKIIAKAKSLYFRNGVHKAAESTKGIWRLAKWARNDSMRQRPLPKFPALQKSLGEKAYLFEDKVSVLRDTFFPPPPQADLADITGLVYPIPEPMDDTITEEEVYRAIYRPKQDKAPRIDGIPNRFLRIVVRKLSKVFTHLFKVCFRLGYHPSDFKKANTIVLRKPQKDDYSEPKSYRPIALLSTLGKALEAVVAKRLSDFAENHQLLPLEQMGARRDRSTITALETIVDTVYIVWDCGRGNVTSLLSLDVAGAFNNVSHRRLIYNLRNKRVPGVIIRWVESFLTNRSTSITLGGRTSAIEPAETGIPQGSPISPILFLFFNAPLIEACSKAKLRLQVGGFVDDIHLIAYEKSTESNYRILEQAYEICLH